MSLPYLDDPGTLDPMTVMELDGLVAKINAFLSREHRGDGSHTAITADSVTVNRGGAVTVQDEQGSKASFVRSVKLGTRIDIQAPGTDATPYLTVRYPISGVLTEQVRIGLVGGGPYARAPGIRLGPAEQGGLGRHIWDIQESNVSAGPALVIGDASTGGRPLVLVFTAGHYEWRPNVALADVWLGSSPEPYARAYVSGGVFEHGRTAAMGNWTDVPYNAANFAATGGTWGVDAGDVLVQRFALMGQTMHYHVWVQLADIGGTTNQLTIALPTGYTVASTFAAPMLYYEAGAATYLTGIVRAFPGDSLLQLLKMTGTNWTPTTSDNTTVAVSIAFEVTG